MKILTALLLTASLAGCAGSGLKFDPGQLGTLQRGQTTASEIYQRFGRPDLLSRNMDGSQTAVYLHADEAGTGSATTILSMDEKGTLREYKTTTRASGSKTLSEMVPAERSTGRQIYERPSPAATAPSTAAPAAATITTAAPAPAATTTSSAPPAAAKPQPRSWSIFDVPSFLPSATKDPRNPQ
jgi:hypothetical protein